MGRVGNRVAIDPRQVYVTVQCYEARAGERGGEPLAGLKGDRAVLAPMYDQRLGADVRKHIPPNFCKPVCEGLVPGPAQSGLNLC